MPQIYKCCLNSPLPGERSQKPSKFFKSHLSLAAETAKEVTVLPEFNTARAKVGLLTEDEWERFPYNPIHLLCMQSH